MTNSTTPTASERVRLGRILVPVAVALFLLAGCGDAASDNDTAEPGVSADAAVEDVDTASDPDADDATASDGDGDDTDDDDGAGENTNDDTSTAEPPVEREPAFPLLVTAPTEPGPRPLLAWDAVEGAASYDLMVLDADGVAYWAWSGAETQVHLGGMENPDAVGAWVFEPLTWVVTALAGDRTPLALSERASLEP